MPSETGVDQVAPRDLLICIARGLSVSQYCRARCRAERPHVRYRKSETVGPKSQVRDRVSDRVLKSPRPCVRDRMSDANGPCTIAELRLRYNNVAVSPRKEQKTTNRCRCCHGVVGSPRGSRFGTPAALQQWAQGHHRMHAIICNRMCRSETVSPIPCVRDRVSETVCVRDHVSATVCPRPCVRDSVSIDHA